MSESATDEDLMRAYAGGDRCGLEQLFRRYAPRLHAFFSRTFKSSAVADDLVQTTFLKVHAARHTFREELPVRPWLYGVAARVRIDELRRRYRAIKGGVLEDGGDAIEDVPVPIEQRPDVFLETSRTAARVRAAVDALPERQRAVVVLHRFEGLTFGEIAIALSEAEGKKLTEVAVRVRAFRAYDALRRALSDLERELGGSEEERAR